MSLENFLHTLQSRPKDELLTLSEANSRKWLIEPVLQELGWNTDRWSDVREVIEEYNIRGRRVDYCLQIGGDNKVFIEAKKPKLALVSHQDQLFDYVRNEDTELAILTNCLDWWFYLPSAEGPWQHKPFVTSNLLTGDPHSLAELLSSYLSKAAIESKRAFDGAETALRGRQRAALVEEALPRAWRRLVFHEDEKLVELLSDLVEQNEGRRPLHTDVVNFLVEQRKLYEPVETREEKKRENLHLPESQKRHRPPRDTRRETKEFSQRILREKFSGTFAVVSPYQSMHGSSDDLVYFGGSNKLADNWWYRVGKGQWELLRSDMRTGTLCFTNAAEGAAYIIPVQDVKEQVKLKQWDRDDLEVNIDFVNNRWRDLDWDIRVYFHRFESGAGGE